MMRGEYMSPMALTTMVSARMASEAGATASSWSMGSACVSGEAAILEPLGQALRPAFHGHVVGALPHVEGVFALRVDVRLDRCVRGVIPARQVEQHVGDV